MNCTCPKYPQKMIYLDNIGNCAKCGGNPNYPLTIKEDPDNIKKIKRRIKDWLDKYASDEEIYEIAWSHNIKTD